MKADCDDSVRANKGDGKPSHLVVRLLILFSYLESLSRFEFPILGWPPQDGNGSATPPALEPPELVWSLERRSFSSAIRRVV